MNRAPIVTVMGHVDHGKTSLLDAIRQTNVAGGESGGITQHIGASQIEHQGKKITFIDTPGHEAFSEMRSRGGKIADIIILVVAANEGIMPQTKEAISHAKAAGVPIIVAINKIDLQSANLPKVKGQLNEEGLLLEEYGGDVIAVEVSAIKKINLDKLLESILVLSEMLDNTDSKDEELSGFVLESKHDPKRGTLVSVVLRKGTLKTGSDIVAGNRFIAKVRSISDYKGARVQEIYAGDPGEILGFKDLPEPGESIFLYTGQELAVNSTPEVVRENSESEDLNVILRADTYGTLEAISAALQKIEFEDRKINILFKEAGDIKESDVLLASVSRAIILAFKVKVAPKILDKAKQYNVLVRQYEIIYEMFEELEGALEGLHEIEEEKVKGRAEILKLFTLPSGDVVAGCRVTHGKMEPGNKVVIKDDTPERSELFRSKIKNIRIGNDSVKRVTRDTECGLLLNQIESPLKVGYIIDVL